MNKGLVTGIFEWFSHPIKSDGNFMDWGAGMVVILCISFLWSNVVNQIE